MSTPSLLDTPKMSLKEAARRLSVHIATVHRWRLRGVGGVRLRVVKIGGRAFVTNDDLETFINRLSDSSPTDAAGRNFCQRAELAGRKLNALGL